MLTCMAILTASCSGNKEGDKNIDSKLEYTLENFETVQIDSLKGILVSDDVSFGLGANIKVLNDSILAVRIMRSPYQVVLHNLATGKNQNAVSTGSGPLEMIIVSGLSSYDDGVLWLLGSEDNKVLTATWNDTADVATITTKYVVQERILNGIIDNNGRVIGLPVRTENVRAFITDTTGNITSTFGTFPEVEMPDSVQPSNIMFHADVAYNPEQDKVIFTNKSWNIIEIFDFADSTSLSLIGPDKIDSKIVESKFPYGVMYDPKPLWLYFKDVSAGPETFCVGYIGRKVTCPEDYQHYINSILEFDYKGNPIKRYKFDHEIFAFDVDFDNRIIYTIELQDDPVIKKYNM